MLTQIKMPCNLEPVPIKSHPGYVCLRASGDNIPLHLVNHQGDEYYINRRKIQAWFRENVDEVIQELAYIHRIGERSYELKCVTGGHIAHTIKATCLSDPARKICFDFVLAIMFSPSMWPSVFPQQRNQERSWYAVPCKIKSPNVENDLLSFIVCSPYWEHMALKKKQNLKDGLRLMKALRDANDMPKIFSYTIKSLFLNAASVKRINWNQSPGRILIRMIVLMVKFLRKGFLPLYLVPDSNVLEGLGKDERMDYMRRLFRILKLLIKCRNRNCMTIDDIELIFGISVLQSL
ncbi:uncharacterized protein LOC108104897 [Drosophila eugracilis]|uniref:uncharacterized protein LOC108104897 n=1 Tax=Drosophila eugracilis TaxID=29029 RepID=UPI0007E7C74B|nr:uncharacterized protein LOC108104897 [Drosophila eugracilis]